MVTSRRDRRAFKDEDDGQGEGGGGRGGLVGGAGLRLDGVSRVGDKRACACVLRLARECVHTVNPKLTSMMNSMNVMTVMMFTLRCLVYKHVTVYLYISFIYICIMCIYKLKCLVHEIIF